MTLSGLIPKVCQCKCILICPLAIVKSINIPSASVTTDPHTAELCKADPSHSLSSHLGDRFQMTGPQDRPIWCGMTDFLFFQPGWEKQYRRGMQEFRTTVSGSGFWRSVFCLCSQPFLDLCSSQHVLLCPFLPSLCTLLPWPHHHFSSTHPLLSHPASSTLTPDLLYFVCSQKPASTSTLLINCFFYPSQLLSLFFPIPIQIVPSPAVLVSSLKCTEGVSGTTKSSLQLSTSSL